MGDIVNIIIGGVITFLGSILGSFLVGRSTIKANRINAQTQKQLENIRKRWDKLEEIYKLSYELKTTILITRNNLDRKRENKDYKDPDENYLLDKITSNSDKSSEKYPINDYSKLLEKLDNFIILSYMYLPETSKEINFIYNNVDDFFKLINEYQTLEDNGSRHEKIEKINQTYDKLRRKFDSYRKQIIEKIESLWEADEKFNNYT